MLLLVMRVGLSKKKKAIAKPESILEENMTKKERKKGFMSCPFFYSGFIKKSSTSYATRTQVATGVLPLSE